MFEFGHKDMESQSNETSESLNKRNYNLEGNEQYPNEVEAEKLDSENKPFNNGGKSSDLTRERVNKAANEVGGFNNDSEDYQNNSEILDEKQKAINDMMNYHREHNYGREDYAEYSKDPEWQKLNAELQKANGMEPTVPDYQTAMENMTKYHSEHNYGREDYAEYSKDPEWQRLNTELQKAQENQNINERDDGQQEYLFDNYENDVSIDERYLGKKELKDELKEYQGEREIFAEDEKNRIKENIVFESKVDANPQFGEGGGNQYFIRDASKMKEDGRLKRIEEDTFKYDGNNENINKKVNDKSISNDELGQLEYNTNPSLDNEKSFKIEDNKKAELSEEEIKQLDDSTPETEALPRTFENKELQKLEDYKQPISDQEDSNGKYYVDGWKNSRNLEPGEEYYQITQVTTDGSGHNSPYFTDAETVDSCRRPDGTIDMPKLMQKLQIESKKNDSGENVVKEIHLTKYQYVPNENTNIREISDEEIKNHN